MMTQHRHLCAFGMLGLSTVALLATSAPDDHLVSLEDVATVETDFYVPAGESVIYVMHTELITEQTALSPNWFTVLDIGAQAPFDPAVFTIDVQMYGQGSLAYLVEKLDGTEQQFQVMHDEDESEDLIIVLTAEDGDVSGTLSATVNAFGTFQRDTGSSPEMEIAVTLALQEESD